MRIRMMGAIGLGILFFGPQPSHTEPANVKRDGEPTTKPLPFRLSTSKPLSPNATSVTLSGQTAGPTPFISQLQLIVSDPSALQSIRFEIAPKSGSVTRAASATYFSDYLQSHGYLDLQSGQVTLPVFGLYSNYSNTVTLTYCFSDGSSQQSSVTVPTGAFTDPCGYNSPFMVQARTNSTDLSYDFVMIKAACGSQAPVIIDTDGAVRWVGTAGVIGQASVFSNNGFYIASKPSGSPATTGISRIEWDGTFSFVKDYASLGVTSTNHHDMTRGKTGMLLEVNTTAQTESVIMEVDGFGNVLKTWNFASIISAAMTAGGDNPALFVHSAPNDWFHNNAAVYRKSDDSLVVSSRENFVICIDYETSAIKWILGDPAKHWYQFQSLRNYALALGPNTLPPIGQHAVSFTSDDNLLLFDNGFKSSNQVPTGNSRTYSAPRRYQIDTQTMVATEIWNYPSGFTAYSPACSSVFEDGPSNYLIDYAAIGSGASQIARLLSLDASGAKIFDYAYSGSGCAKAWNAVPFHLEGLLFTGSVTSGLHVTSVVRNVSASTFAISFPAVNGNMYRLEYKSQLTDQDWLTVSDHLAECSGIAQIIDTTTASQRFYRVRSLTP